MNSLLYLFRTSIKNRLKELVHKPGKLVLYIIIIAVIIAGIFMTLFGSKYTMVTQPLYFAGGIFFAFLLLFFVMNIQKGLLSGDTIFEMSDVNLLFVSPVNPRKILFYGLIKLAKMSFWAGIFILFQSSTLKNFGIDFGGVLIIFFVYIGVMMIYSILSLLIYSVTNGQPARKRIVKVLAVLMFVPLAAYGVYQFSLFGDINLTLNAVLDSAIFYATPIIGWATAGALALIQGNILIGIGWLASVIASGVVMLLYIMLSRSDYYEDVLVATETAFERARAVKEGDVQSTTVSKANIKVKGTGLNGSGASVFLYKHLRESFRENRFGFFGLSTFIMFICILAASLLMKGNIELTIVLQVLMWIQLFMIGTGRGLKELYSPYIFLIPESSFKKIVWANLELVFKTLIESVLLLVIPGIIMEENLMIILIACLVYIFFTMLLIAINFLSIRWTQTNVSQGLAITIYIFATVIIILPGLIPAMIIGFMIGGVTGAVLGLLILGGWELLAALVCFFFSKGVLDNCDMPTVNAFTSK